MRLHPDKSKFITINCNKDTAPFIIDGMSICHTNWYTYLGTPVSGDALPTQINRHLTQKQCHARKFSSFLSKNYDMPFCLKRKVWESAFFSAILYSCETWFSKSTAPLTRIYNGSLRELLGVRPQTPSDLVQVELGLPTAQSLVQHRQLTFIEKLLSDASFEGSPLHFALDLAKHCASPMGKYFADLECTRQTNIAFTGSIEVKNRVRTATSSRASIYMTLNPSLSVHAMYTMVKDPVPEYMRIATSRMRLGSHRLKIETGRWSRIPRENRLCICNEEKIQSEEHVLIDCKCSSNLRDRFHNLDFTSVETLMSCDTKQLCHYCFDITKFFEQQ